MRMLTNCKILMATLLIAVVMVTTGARAQERNPAGREIPDLRLPSPARGPAALSALLSHLPELAASYGKSTEELRSVFLRDHTIWADMRGRLFYACEFGPTPPVIQNASQILQAPYPTNQTFFLHSRPGAAKVIYLDFDGHITSGTFWNYYNGGQDIVSAPYDLDGDPSSFNTTELENIQYMWQRVAEDYAPFEVDVTTQDPGVEGLRKTSSDDDNYGIRVVISPTNFYSTGAGGVAYIGAFNWDTDTPCFVFTQQLANYEKYIAEAASHEVGHTVGLGHDGLTSGEVYYSGHGNWAPIMGVAYYKEVTQFSKGEYAGANNTEDDLAIMPTYGLSYRADDHGSFIGNATPLAGTNISGSGIIETRYDTDMFSFHSGAGTISLTINPAPLSPNLDVYVSLYDGTGNLLASNDGVGLPAILTATVPTGTYYLLIDGVGTGDPSTGYSDYDSLGQYQITGTVVDPGTLSPVAVASASPASGKAPLAVNFSSEGSSDPDGDIQTYYWDFGDGTNSNLPNPAHNYGSAGVYTATLVVTDNEGLSSPNTVTITVNANQPPVAKAGATPPSGYAPLAVSFSSAGSQDPDGSIQSSNWAFGDGSTSSSANPSHTYNSRGTYFAVLTVTDDQGAQGTDSVTIRVQDPNNRPDLIVSKVTWSASSVNAGASLTVTDTTKNLGVAQAAASITLIYFSSDATLDPGDTLIGNRSQGVLNPGSSSSGSTQVTIPSNAAPGTRYLIVFSDGPQTVSESNEANNTRTKSIAVPGPDLLVSSLSAPSSAAAGSIITVNDATKNQGSRPAGPSTTSYYLSIDNTYDAGDTLIGNRAVGALLNGTSNAGPANVTIPAGTVAKTYFIIARADGGEAVAELKETNNTRAYRIVVR